MMVDADELTAVGGPLQLLSDERQRDQLDERELQLLPNFAGDVIGERRVRLVGLARQDAPRDPGGRPAGRGASCRPSRSVHWTAFAAARITSIVAAGFDTIGTCEAF